MEPGSWGWLWKVEARVGFPEVKLGALKIKEQNDLTILGRQVGSSQMEKALLPSTNLKSCVSGNHILGSEPLLRIHEPLEVRG